MAFALNKYRISFFGFALLIQSCGSWGGTEPVVNRYDWLAANFSKTWVLTNALQYRTDSLKRQQIEIMNLGCEADDEWILYRNGKLEKKAGVVPCAKPQQSVLKTNWITDDTFSSIKFFQWSLGSVQNRSDVTMQINRLTDSTIILESKPLLYPKTDKVLFYFKRKSQE